PKTETKGPYAGSRSLMSRYDALNELVGNDAATWILHDLATDAAAKELPKKRGAMMAISLPQFESWWDKLKERGQAALKDFSVQKVPGFGPANGAIQVSYRGQPMGYLGFPLKEFESIVGPIQRWIEKGQEDIDPYEVTASKKAAVSPDNYEGDTIEEQVANLMQLVVMNGNYPMEVHARGCRDLNMPKYRRAPQDWIITGNTVEEAVKKAADELNSQFDDAYDVEDLFRVMPCCNKKTGAAEGYDKPVSLDPTPEDLKRWHNAIYSTYNAIGSDANLEGEKPAVILEVCLDAGHTEAYGGLEPEDYKRFQTWYRSIESKYGYQNGLKRLVKLLNITG